MDLVLREISNNAKILLGNEKQKTLLRSVVNNLLALWLQKKQRAQRLQKQQQFPSTAFHSTTSASQSSHSYDHRLGGLFSVL
jgi:hypothetical protein